MNEYLLSHRMRQITDELRTEGLRQQQAARALASGCGCDQAGRRPVRARAEGFLAVFGLHQGHASKGPAGC